MGTHFAAAAAAEAASNRLDATPASQPANSPVISQSRCATRPPRSGTGTAHRLSPPASYFRASVAPNATATLAGGIADGHPETAMEKSIQTHEHMALMVLCDVAHVAADVWMIMTMGT